MRRVSPRFTSGAPAVLAVAMVLVVFPKSRLTLASDSFQNGRVVFTKLAQFFGAQTNVFAVDADGSNLTQLSIDGGSNPSISLDGNRIAYVSSGDIYLMYADGTDPRRLTTTGGGAPSISCDGKKIAFADDGNIFLINSDGTGLTKVSNDAYLDGNPSLHPDGSKIVYQSGRNSAYRIFTVNADGTNENEVALGKSPSFSPDGSKIAYENGFQIHVINANGTGDFNVTGNSYRNVNPGWSPDGTRIVFTSSRDGNYEIYSVLLNGTDPQRLTTDESNNEIEPTWGGVNASPRAVISASPRSGSSPLTVSADGFSSTVSSGSIASYNWDWGDGSPTDTGGSASHTYISDGKYKVTLTVTDGLGATDCTSGPIWVGVSPVFTEITWDDPGGLLSVLSFSEDEVSVFGSRVSTGPWGPGPVTYQAGVTTVDRLAATGIIELDLIATGPGGSFGSGTGYKCLAQFWNDPDNYVAFGIIHDPGVSPSGVTLMVEGTAQGNPIGGYWSAGAITGTSQHIKVTWGSGLIGFKLGSNSTLYYGPTMDEPSFSILGAARMPGDSVSARFENISIASPAP